MKALSKWWFIRKKSEILQTKYGGGEVIFLQGKCNRETTASDICII